MASGSSVVFLFDENISNRVPRALNRELGQSAFHVDDIVELGRGATDLQVLPYAGDHGMLLVTQDHGILKRPHERALLAKHRIGAFYLPRGMKGLCTITLTIVRHWPEMKRLAATTERPFRFELRQTSIRRMR